MVLKYSELERNILDAYLNGSIFFIYSQWVADGRRLPLETVVRFTADLIRHLRPFCSAVKLNG